MKNMKSKISLALVICTICSLFFVTVSAETKGIDGNIEYTYAGISDEKATKIISKLYNDDLSLENKDIAIAPLSILCLFGHSKQTGTVTQIYHSYYTTSPKCREITTYVEYCTRSSCDYFVVTGEFEHRIGCH